MYRAKAEGGNLCCFSSDQLEQPRAAGRPARRPICAAGSSGELVLHYQPQVTSAPGALGISALLRWGHPELGLIGPERFLPLAEDSGLLEAADRLAVRGRLQPGAAPGRSGPRPVHLALPLLSRQQLAWSGLARRLAGLPARRRAAPGRLEIEIDEDSC